MANSTDIDYSLLFDNSPLQVIVWGIDDPKFTILAQNDRHAALTLDGKPKPIGVPLMEAFPDTSEKFLKTGVSDILESIRRTIRTKKPDPMPLIRYDIADKTGVMIERYWQATHYPLIDDSGKVYAVFQITEDITNQRTADRELDRVHKQLDNILGLAKIGTWQWHVPTNHVTADKVLASMFGVSPQVAKKGLPLDTFTNSIHRDDRPDVIKKIEDTILHKVPFNCEYRTVSMDGTIRWVIARGQVELSNNGEVEYFPGVIIDITESKQASLNAALLAKVSSELANSFDFAHNAAAVADVTVPSVAEWFSIKLKQKDGSLKQIVVRHIDSKITEWAIDAGTVNTALTERVLKTGKAEFYPEVSKMPIKRKAELSAEIGYSSIYVTPLASEGAIVGTMTIGLTSGQRVMNEADKVLGDDLAARISLAFTNAQLYVSALDEIHKRKGLQNDLKRANQELEQRVALRTEELERTNLNLERSNQELQDFAYVASHDLQEPLRKIQAFGTLLQDEYSRELGEGVDYLDRMRSAASRMSTLIEDLLSFSRVTTHAKPYAAVNLNSVLSEVTEDLENRLASTGGKIVPVALPTIMADHTQMRQLFQNLIGNGLKFHKDNLAPIVTISCIDKPDSIELRFADNGVGFDEKYLDRIFAVFQRLHGREVYEGTGIGLAVCRKIVERHGGSITAQSKAGEGATFIVTLAKK